MRHRAPSNHADMPFRLAASSWSRSCGYAGSTMCAVPPTPRLGWLGERSVKVRQERWAVGGRLVLGLTAVTAREGPASARLPSAKPNQSRRLSERLDAAEAVAARRRF